MYNENNIIQRIINFCYWETMMHLFQRPTECFRWWERLQHSQQFCNWSFLGHSSSWDFQSDIVFTVTVMLIKTIILTRNRSRNFRTVWWRLPEVSFTLLQSSEDTRNYGWTNNRSFSSSLLHNSQKRDGNYWYAPGTTLLSATRFRDFLHAPRYVAWRKRKIKIIFKDVSQNYFA